MTTPIARASAVGSLIVTASSAPLPGVPRLYNPLLAEKKA